MFRRLLLALILTWAFGQNTLAQSTVKTPADFGYRHLPMRFGRDTADVLVLSKKGEETVRKPILLFVQGSLPMPLIKLHEKGAYPVFPFKGSLFTDAYHLIIISKPGIPLIASTEELQRNFTYFDPRTQAPPLAYCQRNYLDYYVARNNAVLQQLVKLSWVDARKVVAAGHSEGSTVVAKMAATSRLLTHAISLSGNPAGRMATIVTQQRQAEPETGAQDMFTYWEQIIAEPDKVNCTPGDAPKTTYSFSVPPAQYLRRTRVPLLIVYGSHDAAAPFNDAFRLDMMREQNPRIAFRDYPGLEHNFFGFKDGRVDYDQFHWDDVAQDFMRWVEDPSKNKAGNTTGQ